MQETPVQFLGQEVPQRRDRPPTPVFLGFLGGLNGKELCLQYGRPEFEPWVGKIPWRNSMATHYNILAWKILMNRGAW